MPTVKLRVTGNEYAAAELMQALEAIEGIERAEEASGLMPQMDDEDSSSAGLPDDESRACATSRSKLPTTKPCGGGGLGRTHRKRNRDRRGFLRGGEPVGGASAPMPSTRELRG